MIETVAILVLLVLSALMVFEKREAAPQKAGNRPVEAPKVNLRAEVTAQEATAAARFERDFMRRYQEEVAGH